MLNWNSRFPNQGENEVKCGPPTQSGNNVLWVTFLLCLFLVKWLTRSLREDGSPWVYPRRASSLQSILIFQDTKLRPRFLYMVNIVTHWRMIRSGALQNSNKLTRLWNGLSKLQNSNQRLLWMFRVIFLSSQRIFLKKKKRPKIHKMILTHTLVKIFKSNQIQLIKKVTFYMYFLIKNMFWEYYLWNLFLFVLTLQAKHVPFIFKWSEN